jgi:hypothetical protein
MDWKSLAVIAIAIVEVSLVSAKAAAADTTYSVAARNPGASPPNQEAMGVYVTNNETKTIQYCWVDRHNNGPLGITCTDAYPLK